MKWDTLEELREKIEEDNEVMDSGGLYNIIKDDLNYNLEYAEDRVSQLYSIMDDKLYANCLSTAKYRDQQVKSTTDPLSEEQSYTQHLDKLADYILRANYDNEEDRANTERLKEEQREINKMRDVDSRKKKLVANRDKRSTRQSLLTNKNKSRTKNEVVSLDMKDLDNVYFYGRDENPVHYTRVDRELNQKGNFKNSLKYWLHYGAHNQSGSQSIFNVDYSTPYYRIAYDSINQQNEAIGKLLSQIASTTDLKKRKRLEGLKRELTAEYNVVAERFRSPVVLSMGAPSRSTDILTLIEDKVDYTSKPIVKAIVYGFSELKQYYTTETSSLCWCIIKDFEEAFESITLGKVQKTVAQHVVHNPNWSYKDIIDDVTSEHDKIIGKSTVAYHIENFINKLLNYFIEKDIALTAN